MKSKNTNYSYKRVLLSVFILVEAILYCCFLIIDITGNGSFIISSYLKFTGIILCFILAVMLPDQKADRIDTNILRGALFFTVISDLFILILDYYLAGLVTFCIVQSLYLIRMGIWRNHLELTQGINGIIRRFIRNLSVTIIIIIIIVTLNIEVEGLILVSCFYFVSILFNVWDSIRMAYKSEITNQIIYAVGMVLFLLCDINVGLFNLTEYLTIDNNSFNALYNFASIAMWMFYLPAQVLISLSVQFNKTVKLPNCSE